MSRVGMSAMGSSSRQSLLPWRAVVEYLGLKESGGDSHKFCRVNPKSSTTAGFGGIFMRDRLEELPIASSREDV